MHKASTCIFDQSNGQSGEASKNQKMKNDSHIHAAVKPLTALINTHVSVLVMHGYNRREGARQNPNGKHLDN